MKHKCIQEQTYNSFIMHIHHTIMKYVSIQKLRIQAYHSFIKLRHYIIIKIKQIYHDELTSYHLIYITMHHDKTLNVKHIMQS